MAMECVGGRCIHKLLEEAHFRQPVHFETFSKKDGKIPLQQTLFPTCDFS